MLQKQKIFIKLIYKKKGMNNEQKTAYTDVITMSPFPFAIHLPVIATEGLFEAMKRNIHVDIVFDTTPTSIGEF